MTTRRFEHVAPEIRSFLAIGPASGLSDGELLERFAGEDSGASGLAFEILVERHGPMVLRVCRGVLRDPHDSQDAFQATFLVLVRRAGSIRDRDSIASWLHGVALRVARHAKGDLARRRRLDREVLNRAEPSTTHEAADDLGSRLHEEVGRLPERYRAAVVLCYLEGHTCEDAARVLNWPVGTVKSRLSRARDRLRGRLTRLGLPSAFPPLSPRLATSTAQLASRFGAGSSAPASSLGAVALAEGVLKMMTLAKWKSLGIALLTVASSIGVASALTLQDPPKAESRKQAREKPKAKATNLDPDSDPVALAIPRYLEAQAGSGTALMYALDERGERIFEDRAKAAAKEEAIKKAKRALDNRGNRINEANREALEKALEDALALPIGPWKEAQVPLRWVVVTGVVANLGVREALAEARKIRLADAYPDFKRVDVQRQVRRRGGDWSDWDLINQDKNYEVLDNLPALSKERTPAEYRPEALVDPLPLLTKGTWSGVDHERILRLPKPEPDRALADKRPRHQSPLLAIRSLDFTVEPGTTYRYRVRVVLVNPDVDRDVKRELESPWRGPSKEVVVP